MPKAPPAKIVDQKRQKQLLCKEAVMDRAVELGFTNGSPAFRHYVNNLLGEINIAPPILSKSGRIFESSLLDKKYIDTLEFAYNGKDLEMGTIARRFEITANANATEKVGFDQVDKAVFSALKNAAAVALGKLQNEGKTK